MVWNKLNSITFLKYLFTSCLTLTIISTIGLNLARSYSTSNTLANAEQSSSSATTSTNASDPASIKLSITPLSTPTSSNCDTSTPNICLDIPDGGGIATGGHAIKVWTNSVAGWRLFLTTSNTTGSQNGSSLINPNVPTKPINSLSSSIDFSNATTLSNNTWGVAFPYGEWQDRGYYSQEANYTSSNQATLSGTKWTSLAFLNDNSSSVSVASRSSASANDPNNDGNDSSVRHIYYGVRVDDPGSMVAGNYTANLTYTATVQLPPTPTITSITPNTYELGSGEDSTVTITGTNLLSTNRVYMEVMNNTEIDCTNINVIDDTKLTCQIPTDDNSIINPGTYTVYIKTQAEKQGKLEKGFEYTRQSICRNADPDSDCQVDIDDNMIPVVYDGYDGNGGGNWRIVTKDEIESDKGSWYDYGEKKWANAVTVQADKLQYYKDAMSGTNPNVEVNNNDVLGYWVYIPRYAYEVQRREVSDMFVSDSVAQATGGFNIRFETSDDAAKTPAECLSSRSDQYYWNCAGISRKYGAAEGTTWATHSAFSWGDSKLNGFWVGKFETTGTVSQPTVLPNEKHMSLGQRGSIGAYYSIAKSIGVNDAKNTGGSDISGLTSTNGNVASATSHMLKNSEWGAIAYLSSSRYGAGVNAVQNNANIYDSLDDNNDMSRGITGCGPSDNGDGAPYSQAGTVGTSTACGDADRSYGGYIGVLASTTNSIYGVYDMAGGSLEYVASGVSTAGATEISGSYFDQPASKPYVDIYDANVFNGNDMTNNNKCTWDTCGGQALYETKNIQSINEYDQYDLSWGGGYSYFAYNGAAWSARGGFGSYGNNGASVYASGEGSGQTYGDYGFRVVLLSQ